MKRGMLVRIFPYFIISILLSNFYLASGQSGIIQNLKAIRATSQSVTLAWTAPENEDALNYGHYDLRYAQHPITNENFDQATKVEMAAAGLPIGIEVHTIDKLNPGTPYFFALRYKDFPGRYSPLSNIVHQDTPQAGSISVSPGSIEESLLSAETSTRTLSIHNSGAGDLEVLYYAEGFVRPSPPPSPIPPGGSFNVDVIIDAGGLTTGTYNQDFIIYTNDSETPELHIPITLHVTDNGFPVARNTGIDSYHFGEVYVGDRSVPGWTFIANMGSEPLVISEIGVTNPDIHVDELVQPVTLAPSEEYYLLFQYRPTVPGPGSGQIQIHSNDPANPILEITVSADCIESPVQLVLDKTSLSDTIARGQTSVQTVTLGNEGLDDLEFTINTWSLPSFMTVTPLSGVLHQYESMELEVVFDASGLTPGIYEYEITIENNDPRYYGAYFLPVKYVVDGAVVNNFALVNFKTGAEITTFHDKIVLDVADPQIENYTIQANATSQTVGVKFSLDNKEVNTDNSKPYRINNWVLPVLAKGDHIISAQAAEQGNVTGGSLKSTISIINSAAITDFDVVNAEGIKLMDLEDGGTIDLSQLGTNSINIVANTSLNTVKSVRFIWGGTTARIDNQAPFALKGTSSGDTFWSAKPGSYTLTAYPYMKFYGWGPDGMGKAVRFQIVQGSAPALAGGQQREIAKEATITSSLEGSETLILYPVPVENELHISINVPHDGILVNIVDLQGKLVKANDFVKANDSSSPYTINTHDLSSGFYILQVKEPNGRTLSKRFIKN